MSHTPQHLECATSLAASRLVIPPGMPVKQATRISCEPSIDLIVGVNLKLRQHQRGKGMCGAKYCRKASAGTTFVVVALLVSA